MIINYSKHGHILAVLWFAITTTGLLAQPDAINYQTVVRDGDGQLVTNENVDFRFYIRRGSSDGTIVYQETHQRATNDQGLVSLLIGRGFQELGSFSGVNWGKDDHYLEMEVDIGQGFVNMGTQQLVSVPYALSAVKSDSANFSAKSDSAQFARNAHLSDTAKYAQNAVPSGDAGGDLDGTYPNPDIRSNAISASNIWDEPGINWSQDTENFDLVNNSGINQIVDSVTIGVPAAGNVVVKANGYVIIRHGALLDNVAFNVTDDLSENIFTNGVSSVTVPDALPAADYRYPFHCLRVFQVDESMNLTVYLIVRQFNGSDIDGTDVTFPVIQATYYPTTYYPLISIPIPPILLDTPPSGTVD